MNNLTPIGYAIVGAIAIPLGYLIFSSIGWIDEPNLATYALGAIAGLVGGWVGGVLRRRRTEKSIAGE